MQEMTEFQEIVESVANEKIKEYSQEYKDRLKDEIKFIYTQGYEDYWIDIVKSGKKYDSNKNGLVLPYILGITNVDPVNQKINHVYERHPDFPDIDIDFLPISRDMLKEYISNKYGDEYVCSVGNWITYKPKSALQDVCRALGDNFREVMSITKQLPDDFDDMTLEDLQKIRNGEDENDDYELYKLFFDYWDMNPRVVDIAFRISGMIRAKGTHAGGVIISNSKLFDLIPLSYKDGIYSSQWTEGKSTQLSKFGLIKFDLLGLKTMQYIWKACEFINDQRGIKFDWDYIDPRRNILGKELHPDGTEKFIYWDDSISMEMINDLNTESIFQHETPIQKDIIRKGKVKDFRDMVAYSSLGRPGPMDMIPEYIKNRDDEKESWKDGVDQQIIDILKDTYGILCFQEQLTMLWRKLGKFSVVQAEESRKIISKKWLDKLPKVKERWLKGATEKIGESAAKDWWDKMQSFGRYAFNKCLSGQTIVRNEKDGREYTIEELYEKYNEDIDFKIELMSKKNGKYVQDILVDIHYNGEMEVHEVEFDNGVKIECTMNHKFLCEDNQYHELKDIIDNDLEMIEYEPI